MIECDELVKKGNCLQRKREICNTTVQTLIQQIQVAVNNRDDFNIKVSSLKDQRIELTRIRKQKEKLVKNDKNPKFKETRQQEIEGIAEKADTLHSQVKLLASESQKYHNSIIELGKQKEKKMREAQQYHKQLVENQKFMNTARKEKQKYKRKIARSRKQLKNVGLHSEFA